jgi:protein tyrosine/serine phosphatase
MKQESVRGNMTSLSVGNDVRSLSFRSTGSLLASAWLGLFLSLCLCSAAPRGVPAQQGINNFGKISDILYRGAQPDAVAMTNLSKLGIKTIINLREPDKSWQAEIEQARLHGIVFTNIPFKGLGSPNPEQVARALAAIEALPSPIFIHCQHGCDRTGTIIACYRIQHDKWSCDAALKEAELYGISKFERGMRRYILSFGAPQK